MREYHYREDRADTACDELSERLSKAVWSFCNDQQYEELREAGCSSGSVIEKRFSIAGEGYKINGQIDLAYQKDESAHVVDWKLGKSDGKGNDSLQLAVYGLWATHEHGYTPTALNVSKVHLGSNDIISFKADDVVLANAKARIEQDVDRMRVLDKYGKEAEKEAFTPCNHEKVCRLCAFERICYDRD